MGRQDHKDLTTFAIALATQLKKEATNGWLIAEYSGDDVGRGNPAAIGGRSTAFNPPVATCDLASVSMLNG